MVASALRASVALTVLAVFAASAPAATPVAGARYADTDYAFWADLRVSKTGRWFNARASSVANTSDWQCSGLDFHLGTGRLPVRITPRGRFKYVSRRGRFVLRVSGRFQTKDVARISFRFHREPRRRSHPCDDSGRVSLRPQRIREIPFSSCREHTAETVYSTQLGRVFWQPRWDSRDGWTKVAYACLYSANLRFALGQDDDDDSDLDLFRIAEPYVAYEGAYCSVGCAYDLTVLDLRDGRRVREVPGHGMPGGGLDAQIGHVTDLELKDNSSIAWIALPNPYSSVVAPTVSAYDSLGRRPLDSGNIALESLTLDGSTLSWIKDGAIRSAPLE